MGVFGGGQKCFDVFCVIKVTGALGDACYLPYVYLEVVERVYMYACYLPCLYLEVVEWVYIYACYLARVYL